MKRFMMLFSANRKEESIIRHFLIKILLLLFLSTSYLSASHIHHDDVDHEEGCEVCVVINNFHSGDIPHSTVEILSIGYSYDEISQYDNYQLGHLPLGYYSTAPPAS
ncbi:MAG: hypothetical protein HKP62_07935 [Sulfurovum sp.]|nr:hypothetical protein [Sulfurovum sp.]NNJ45931.1 hypothetical protein [Sulfurovum sp.]